VRYISAVNARTKQVLAEALELTPGERALLADELEASLPPEEIEKAWADELERRAREVLEGRSKGRDANEVIAEIRAELTATKR
jgi:putative addiction module component (TIGR02574 family)